MAVVINKSWVEGFSAKIDDLGVRSLSMSPPNDAITFHEHRLSLAGSPPDKISVEFDHDSVFSISATTRSALSNAPSMNPIQVAVCSPAK